MSLEAALVLADREASPYSSAASTIGRDALAGAYDRLTSALQGRYAIERELGQGGMATVYLAGDLKHRRRVAIKVLRTELASAVGPERFLRDIEIAARLQHPHILPLYDSGEAAGFLFYVMPYVEGESLRHRLGRETQLPLEEATEIAKQIAEGLSYAHGHAVVHRDIQPENVLLAGGQAVVADFGIARAVDAAGAERLTATGVAIGTPAYMSPEQASGRPDVDARSDVYSLGCVLYEMLAGHPPFLGATSQEILARHTLDPVPPLKSARATVPEGLEEVIVKALAKVPADRFTTAAVFAAALDLAHVAVMYFEDLSRDGSLAHGASGLTENLIDEFGRVAVLHVISPNGVRPYRERRISLDSVARILRVGTLVEGSVASSADRLRVTVRLIDATTLQQLQSAALERRPADLLSLLDDVAREVSGLLRERLGRELVLRERRKGTTSAAAWELVQRADRLRADAWQLGLRAAGTAMLRDIRRADSLLAEAERLDRLWAHPSVARGWLALWMARQAQAAAPSDSERQRDAGSWFSTGLAHADRALSRDSGDAEALELRGTLRYAAAAAALSARADTLLRAAEHDLVKAVEVEPSRAGGWRTLSNLYQASGRFDEADLAARRAFEADAFLSDAPAIMSRLMFASLNGARFDEARRWCAEGQRRFPGDPRFVECELVILGWSASGRRQVERAWQLLDRIEAHDTMGLLEATRPVRRFWVAAILARTGFKDSALAVVRRTRAATVQGDQLATLAYYEAYVRTLLGERADALRLLGDYLGLSGQARWSRRFVARSLWFRPLHADSQFHALTEGRP